MHQKVIKLVRLNGACCQHFYFRYNADRNARELWKELGQGCSIRSIQQNKAKFLDGQFHCENLTNCRLVK